MGEGVKEVAVYENGELAAIASQFGEEKVVVFSPYRKKYKPRYRANIQNAYPFGQFHRVLPI